jgi:hypothetical protein
VLESTAWKENEPEHWNPKNAQKNVHAVCQCSELSMVKCSGDKTRTWKRLHY